MNRHVVVVVLSISLLAHVGSGCAVDPAPQTANRTDPVMTRTSVEQPQAGAQAEIPAVPGVGPDAVPRNERFVPEPPGVAVTSWVSGLEVPWSLVFVDATDAFVSERPGRIRRIRNGRLLPEPWARIDVATGGERGLMGLALHPQYPSEPWLYAMHSYSEGGRGYTRVVRLQATADRGTVERVIIDQIPGAQFHDGGRIAFGPDGMLYVCTGDARQPDRAQDLQSLAGKILRLTPGGEIPPDNPIANSPVYAYGLRNPQGLAWHPTTGDLIVSDHGPSGERGLRAHDQIHRIVPGGNHGWPRTVTVSDDPELVDPLIVWPDQAVPPGGIAFIGETLFVSSMRSEALLRIPLVSAGGTLQVGPIERWFARDRSNGVYGRLRDAVRGPDGALYVLTTNRDGRGRTRQGDDRILRIEPGER
jgi:glucose/arabinose dehydrogenase